MFKDLIRYTELADKSVIDIFESLATDVPQAEALFSHVLNAQHIWLTRIKKTQPLYERLQNHPKEIFLQIHQQNIKDLNELLETADLEETISFKIFTGEVMENKIADVLFHVVNHSTYHRGQVVTLLKQAGATPPVTDYVHLKRKEEF